MPKHLTLTIQRTILPVIGLALLCIALGACTATEEAVRIAPVKERFDEAMAEFNDEDYEAARKLFEAIVLQDPASEYADDAQYYLAESYFLDGDYHLAAYGYNRVRSFPNSPFYKIAVYKTGESYFKGSEAYDRDQKETRAAIDHFRSFISAYSGDSLATVAQQRITALRTKLAQRDYSIGEQYRLLDDPAAAVVYYQKVIDEFSDTEYYAMAVGSKLHALCMLERSTDARKFADSLVLARPNDAGAARTFQSMGCH